MATITPSDDGAGGIFTPASVVLDDNTLTAEFTYTPAAQGDVIISVTNDGGFADPADVLFSALPLPLTIAGLQAWYKADTITPVADGTQIDQWDDSSGNGNHATQTGATRPSYKSNALRLVRTPPEAAGKPVPDEPSAKPIPERQDRVNLRGINKPVVNFGGGQFFNLTTPIPAVQPWTTFAVLMAQNYYTMPTFGTPAGTYGGWGIALYGGAGADGFVEMNDGATTFRTTQTLAAWTFYIVSMEEQSSSPTFYVNGVLQGVTGSGYAGGVNPFAHIGLRTQGDASQSVGQIAELLRYNRALTAKERQSIEKYLGDKYNMMLPPGGVAGLKYWLRADLL
jgi:hypothetical protein